MVLFSSWFWADGRQPRHRQSCGGRSGPPREQADPKAARASLGIGKALTTVPKLPQIPDGDHIHVSMRVTSLGHALIHEIPGPDDSNDPLTNDHPVTVLYLDGDRLMLTHYCDAGNRPRMLAKPFPTARPLNSISSMSPAQPRPWS